MGVSHHELPAGRGAARCSGAPIAAETVYAVRPPGVACWSPRLPWGSLNKNPNVAAACLEVRLFKGEMYIKVRARVRVSEGPLLSVTLMDSYGSTLGTVMVRRPQAPRVLLNGVEVKSLDPHSDEEFTFWVPGSIFTTQTTVCGEG